MSIPRNFVVGFLIDWDVHSFLPYLDQEFVYCVGYNGLFLSSSLLMKFILYCVLLAKPISLSL